MDLYIDPEVTGEVLIPLENGSFFPNKNIPSFQDIFTCSYKNFRNVLFQGESLKFYIVLKSSKQKSQNISDFFDKILFKIDFDPNDIEKNLNINENGEEMIDINNKENVFNFYSTNKSRDEKINEINNNEIEFEEINNKIYDEETCSEIYEIIKEIIVPDKFINFNFLMKISLYLENRNAFSEDNKENNILNLYQLGVFDNINNYRHFKIFFKEVKIINALNILNMKQLEPKIDTSLVQTKLSNYNDNYDLYDISLKNSKIFKNMSNEENTEKNIKEEKIINICDIRILKYETCFDENATEEIEFIKNILIKEKKLLSENDYDISLFNKNKFPLMIGSGEEFNLLFKITKNAYINESIYSTNNINNNIKKGKTKSPNLLAREESNSQSDLNKIIINQMSDSYFHSSIFFNPQALEDEDDLDNLNFKKKNSLMLPQSQSKSISQKIQQPLFSLGNLIKKKITFSDVKDEKEKEAKDEQNNLTNKENTSNTNSNSIKRINTIKSKSNINEGITENDQYLDLDSYFEEQFRIYYITPIILELHSKLFSENINMCINMKWFNEINRYLKISISIPEHIYISQYFEIKIKIKNISFYPMNLIVQIKDNENKEIPAKNKKQKNIENVQSILSQTKVEQFGLINSGDEKIFKLKFLPNVKGFCYLPNLTLIDIYSNKKFYVVQNNKIFVEEIKL